MNNDPHIVIFISTGVSIIVTTTDLQRNAIVQLAWQIESCFVQFWPHSVIVAKGSVPSFQCVTNTFSPSVCTIPILYQLSFRNFHCPSFRRIVHHSQNAVSDKFTADHCFVHFFVPSLCSLSHHRPYVTLH